MLLAVHLACLVASVSIVAAEDALDKFLSYATPDDFSSPPRPLWT